MYQYKSPEDTIVAISTAMGQAGIGIVRFSGKVAIAIADEMFVTKSNKKPSDFKSFTVHFGEVIDSGMNKKGPGPASPKASVEAGPFLVIDEALLTVMRAPKSYTKEDVVEISCHGGIASLRAILARALDLGARLAEPGEFTKRAFLNGRIDLTQAEAVLDIIQSKTDAFLQVSTHQLKGELSAELDIIREHLMNIYVEIEAIVNFPEDEIDAQGKEKLVSQIDSAGQRVERLLASSEHGKILKEGIKIVLCGKPNVGKSSLLNFFLRQSRAIVSEIAGTTRDTIEETAQIKGIPFQLIDTAGVLEPRDLIEEEAIKRSHMHMKSADLVLLVLDASGKLTQEDDRLMDRINGQNALIILNKCDLQQRIEENRVREKFCDKQMFKISVLKKTAIDELETAVVENVWHSKTIDTHGVLISNLRHIDSLKNCRETLTRARQLLRDGLSLEFISEEIKTAVNFLDSITGRNIDADLLNNIFSQFCIGK